MKFQRFARFWSHGEICGYFSSLEFASIRNTIRFGANSTRFVLRNVDKYVRIWIEPRSPHMTFASEFANKFAARKISGDFVATSHLFLQNRTDLSLHKSLSLYSFEFLILAELLLYVFEFLKLNYF